MSEEGSTLTPTTMAQRSRIGRVESRQGRGGGENQPTRSYTDLMVEAADARPAAEVIRYVCGHELAPAIDAWGQRFGIVAPPLKNITPQSIIRMRLMLELKQPLRDHEPMALGRFAELSLAVVDLTMLAGHARRNEWVQAQCSSGVARLLDQKETRNRS